ncbi:MAG: DUF3703 domain-containing protein [Hydrogenophaga sp.]|jgi:hypothetical protein|nr:DUF3703 domain-containing protein [Hydrogenophaga sp.]
MAMRNEPAGTCLFDETVHARLLHAARAAGSAEHAWRCLEAAHVVGQIHFKLHWQTHANMLGLAWRTCDWPEATGQLIRLALVPVGHLSGRLPLGNPGRATVSAFKAMSVRPDLTALIDRARGN